MPNFTWSGLSNPQFRELAIQYARMEFLSYGFDVLAPAAGDNDTDFVVKSPKTNCFYEIKVVSERAGTACFPKSRIDIYNEKHIVCLLRFRDEHYPRGYLISATVWQVQPHELFSSRDYDEPGQNANPDYNIKLSQRNRRRLDDYLIAHQITKL